MAVFLEHLNVLVPVAAIRESAYPGGFDGLLHDRAVELGLTLWHDGYLLREGALTQDEVESVLDFWKGHGLMPTHRVRGILEWKDLCVIDAESAGLSLPCAWIELDSEGRSAFLRGQEPGPLVGAP